MTDLTQAQRVHRYIKAHPGCTTLDLLRGLDPPCTNPRARISDLRKEGIDVACDLVDGVHRYRVREPGPLAFDWDRAS